jgi:protein-disulfide isomerase
VPVLEQVLEKYPRKVKVVFKQFPIRSHVFALKAAQATIAAHQQGKFWEFHDLLFNHYKQINDKKIEEIRIQLGLDDDKFKKKMRAPQTMNKIRADYGNGSAAGVRGTPTVFINGKLLRDKSLNGFQRAIGVALQALKAG